MKRYRLGLGDIGHSMETADDVRLVETEDGPLVHWEDVKDLLITRIQMASYLRQRDKALIALRRCREAAAHSINKCEQYWNERGVSEEEMRAGMHAAFAWIQARQHEILNATNELVDVPPLAKGE